MKKSNYWKSEHGYLYSVVLVLIIFCFAGCKDNDEAENVFDPGKPVLIKDFLPKKGGFGSNLILYGDNFGNNPSNIKVTIGGKSATIVTVKNNSLYCIVPSRAYDGDIHVSIYDNQGEEIAYAEAEGTFEYEKKWLVTTLIGKRYEVPTDEVEKEGPFNDCGCFKKMTWFSFDPKSNFDRMYITTHDCPPNRLVDFTNEYVSYFKTSGLSRPSIISWTADTNGDMIISDDIGTANKTGNWLFSRESGFTTSTGLTQAQSVTGAMVHPITGELYYAVYYNQDVWRYDFKTKELTSPFRHLRTKETIRMVVHPTGKYAYLIQNYYSGAGRYIARADYDEVNKTFTTPYIVCGSDNTSGYADGVGDKALLSRPAQGAFVKNPDYMGEEDEYDFYFCDQDNHAIRILTPQGRVSTFAGRGNNGTSGYADGELRTEARFDSPIALAYDEKRQCFYVGDNNNKVIRKIAREE